MTVEEFDQLKTQNALLLKRLLAVSRERDALAARLAAIVTVDKAREGETQ